MIQWLSLFGWIIGGLDVDADPCVGCTYGGLRGLFLFTDGF
jgi:hypothetical protein